MLFSYSLGEHFSNSQYQQIILLEFKQKKKTMNV